ncbi:MAG: MlaE family lipid ABC transporter permease subunit [Myxococcota bacterium]
MTRLAAAGSFCAHVPERAFQVSRVDGGGPEVTELRLRGDLRFREGERLIATLREQLTPSARELRLDLSQVEVLDGGSSALLLELAAELERGGTRTDFVGSHGPVRRVLDLHRERARPTREHVAPPEPGFLEQVGGVVEELLRGLDRALTFMGDVLAEGVGSLRRLGLIHWRDLGKLVIRTGFDALPIVSLICFLVGLVTGFQAAVQLQQLGADIYVADLVGISVTRELGPLITAIVVAGRSGAAYAAELGTMRVSEEIDALASLGLDPYRFLVFPRVIALVLVLPVLTLVGDALGIFGGLFVAVTGLDLTPAAYLIETQLMVGLDDVFSGVLKSVFFGGMTALVACQRGLATSGGAEGVGRSTTSAVVTILFLLIVLDAAFTVLYHVFEI